MTEATFKTRLNSILKDNAIERFVGGKKKGKVNTKRLYKINDSRKIFKQKEERKGKDYSITFLLDASGSMSSQKGVVCEAMTHIGNSLNRTDIPFSIYTFSEVTRLIKKFDEKYKAKEVEGLYKKMFGMTFEFCYNQSCGEFDVAEGSNCPSCGRGLGSSGNGGTNDALALHIVGNEIHKVYKKNILVVITDGSGDNLEYSWRRYGKVAFSSLKNNRTVINKLHKKYDDLLLLAISIGTDYTKEVYGGQYSYNIRSASEIFDAVAKLLNRHIKRG